MQDCPLHMSYEEVLAQPEVAMSLTPEADLSALVRQLRLEGEVEAKLVDHYEEAGCGYGVPLQVLSTTVTNSVRRRTFRNLRTKDLVVRERPVAPQNPNKVPMPVGDEFTAVTQRQAEELWNGKNHAPMTRLLVAAVVARKESP